MFLVKETKVQNTKSWYFHNIVREFKMQHRSHDTLFYIVTNNTFFANRAHQIIRQRTINSIKLAIIFTLKSDCTWSLSALPLKK